MLFSKSRAVIKAIWNGGSSNTTPCAWKDDANYFNIDVDGLSTQNGVWDYLTPKEAATEIANRVALIARIR